MTTPEFEAYKGEVQLRMNGMKNHAIACKLAGIESLVKDGLSDMPAMVTIIEQEKANINKLLKGESLEHFGKSKEFKGYQTIGG